LIELRLARELNTSQGPIREALRELEAMRLVETVRYRGTRVRVVTPEEIRQATEVRGVLEELAARQAAPALRGRTEELARELKALEQAARAGDFSGYARHNLAFHRRVVEAAGNKPLLEAWDLLAMEVNILLTLSRRPFIHAEIIRQHSPILAALDRGDGPLAGRLLRRHAESAMAGVASISVGRERKAARRRSKRQRD
jgi:DNA-binding GntR family transcriptional regulator